MKIEMHSHIMEQSSDSQISASDYIYLLKEYGYKGIVSTDHFLSSELSNTDGDGFKEKCCSWLSGYYALLDAAEENDILVLLGMEYTLEYVNKYTNILLYGLTEEMVMNGLIRPYMSPEELRDICLNNDIIMIQAHPERYGNHTLPIKFVDGYEIKNTKNRPHYTKDYNSITQQFVKDKSQLITIGGGDCHVITDVGKGGIDTYNDIKTIDDLKNTLRTGQYDILSL